MIREDAIDLLDRLQEAQNEFYAGGEHGELDRLLAPDVVWVVPGDNRIAGVYRGRDQVLAYFRRRGELAGGTFRMTRRDLLVGEGNRLAALTDGAATIGAVRHHWSTLGLYEVEDGCVKECRLLALYQPAFDAIWAA